MHKYNIYKIHQIHILFFKNIEKKKKKRALYKQKKEQANNFYASNLVKKSIKLWKLNYKIKKDKNNKLLRRKIIGKIYSHLIIIVHQKIKLILIIMSLIMEIFLIIVLLLLVKNT